MKHIGKLIFGTVMVLIGILLLMENLNIVTNFAFIESIRLIWPLGLIIAGGLIFFKQKGTGTLLLIITIIFGIFATIVPTQIQVGELKIQEFNQVYNNEEFAVYDISLGGTKLILNKIEDEANLINVRSKTTLPKELTFDVTKENGVTYVNINENGHIGFSHLFNLDKEISRVNISLNPNPKTKLKFNYGAIDGTLDLRELNIEELNIESGATDTEIYFGKYPTLVDISAGVSNINFYFPENISIEIESDGGVSSLTFKDFKKVGNKYYSPNFNEVENKILIKISSGVSTINGEVIKNE